MTRDELEEVIRRVTAEVLRSMNPLGKSAAPGAGTAGCGNGSGGCSRGEPCACQLPEADVEEVRSVSFEGRLLSEEALLSLAVEDVRLRIAPATLVTPLARDAARERGIEIVVEPQVQVENVSSEAGQAVGFYSDSLGASFDRLIQEITRTLPVAVMKSESAPEAKGPRRSTHDSAAACARGVVEGRYRRAVILHEDTFPLLRRLQRIEGVRASLCSDLCSAEASRRDRDDNVLLLSSRSLGLTMVGRIVESWLREEER